MRIHARNSSHTCTAQSRLVDALGAHDIQTNPARVRSRSANVRNAADSGNQRRSIDGRR
jgi:hypothetical protein